MSNELSLMIDQLYSGTPMVMTAGNKDIHKIPPGRSDLANMARPYAKWSTEITHAEQVPAVIRRAFQEARTVPTGPVFRCEVRLLTVIDEYTRECMAIQAARRIRSDDVMHTLTGLFTSNGVPEHIRSDNGPEFTAKAIRDWLPRVGVRTLFIQPRSPWENGCNESFNGKLRDELLNGEIFYSLREVQILTERWRQEYNTIRPHSSLGYRPPAPGDNKVETGRRTNITSGTGYGGRSYW